MNHIYIQIRFFGRPITKLSDSYLDPDDDVQQATVPSQNQNLDCNSVGLPHDIFFFQGSTHSITLHYRVDFVRGSSGSENDVIYTDML